MDSKAQVAFDYLVMVTFVLVFVVAVAMVVTVVSGVAKAAMDKILQVRGSTIASLLG